MNLKLVNLLSFSINVLLSFSFLPQNETTRHKMTTSFRIFSSENERKFLSSSLFGPALKKALYKYPRNRKRTSFCCLCCKPTSKGQLAPFSGCTTDSTKKESPQHRESQWHGCCRLSGSRTASEGYQWQFDIGRGESRFQGNSLRDDGVSVSLVVNGQSLIPGVAEAFQGARTLSKWLR